MSAYNYTHEEICLIFQSLQNYDIGVVQTNLKALLPLIYAIPSLILSLRIMTILINGRKREEFSSSFYRLFLAASIVVKILTFDIGNI